MGPVSNGFREALRPDADVQKKLFRERIKRQLVLSDANGAVIKLDDDSINLIPAIYAFKLKDAIADALSSSSDDSEKPEMINKGDGLLTPIIVRLGKPIRMKKGQTETIEIAELEFQADKLLDVEDILVADNKLTQTVALLKIAKPLGAGTLTSMPTWAYDMITLTDGAFLLGQVLPVFSEGVASS